ncbi:MAG: chemotaxis-specific protein-glutamate methyltransferase CheB [Actinobacteria bacterium]|nr:chemotaxis-specific protein-glutamate methyltransferase CheB [Actinomycetota bacterium]
MRSTIKVLVVDDSALIRQMLTRALALDPAVEIVGTAKTGLEAIEKAHQLQPAVITLDIEMPELSGLEALPHIIKSTPARVVMLSSLSDAETTYQALDQGAVDFMVKPASGFATSLAALTDELLKKIKIAYRVSPDLRLVSRRERSGSGASPKPPVAGKGVAAVRVVAIAASTGGPPALETVFSGLSRDLEAAYLIVQHLPVGFTESLARRLQRVTDITVTEADSGMSVDEGVAYLAPHGVHMSLEGRALKRIALEDTPSMHGVKPAADPTLESAASHFAERSVGVVLTGMGSDGARGLQTIREAGGETIAQDEATSVVWGMPGAAARSGAAARVVPLGGVAAEIRRAVRG